MDLRQRFDEFAGRFREKPPGPEAPRPPQADYWSSVQALFTRDVTPQAFRELVERDARETYRFFTRELDLSHLRAAPWYRRYPRAAWEVFQALAYRLSPARRVLFAGATLSLILGWADVALRSAARGGPVVPPWILAGATVLFALVLLELKDKLTLKGDLEIARQIQFGLLPFAPYRRGGVRVDATMRPANTVGGDYFDLIELGSGRLALVIGDVAGKGMPAALLMALLQGSLRTLLTAGLRGTELIAKLNDHLYANIPSNRLITLFYAELDGRAGELAYVNAGHNAPFLLHPSGAWERLDPTGVALGVVEAAAFAEGRARLLEGDRLVLFTDGVTEATNARDEEYGEERVAGLLAGRREASQREALDALIEDVLAFCGTSPPRDDMTLMAVSREA